jgi:hypothetical protein
MEWKRANGRDASTHDHPIDANVKKDRRGFQFSGMEPKNLKAPC